MNNSLTSQKQPNYSGIRATKSLQKYDHISRHRNNLNWLPISYQIKFRSIHAMLLYYRQDIGCLLLDPPIQFGRQHSYQTRCRENFASVAMCRLASTMRHFRFAASTWWNSLPTHIHDNNINVVRKFYLDDCLSCFLCVYYSVVIFLRCCNSCI